MLSSLLSTDFFFLTNVPIVLSNIKGPQQEQKFLCDQLGKLMGKQFQPHFFDIKIRNNFLNNSRYTIATITEKGVSQNILSFRNALFNPFATTCRFSGSRKKCPKHYAPEIQRKKHCGQLGIIARQISLEGGLPITIGFPEKFLKLQARKNMVSPENFELP